MPHADRTTAVARRGDAAPNAPARLAAQVASIETAWETTATLDPTALAETASLADALNDARARAIVLRLRSIEATRDGDLDRALDAARTASQSALEQADRRVRAMALGSLGSASLAIGEHADAMHALERALREADTVEEPALQGALLGSLAVASLRLGNGAAEQLLRASRAMLRETPLQTTTALIGMAFDETHLAAHLVARARVQTGLHGKADARRLLREAVACARSALRTAERIAEPRVRALMHAPALDTLAQSYLALGRTRAVVLCLRRARALVPAAARPASRVARATTWAAWLLDRRRPGRAAAALRAAGAAIDAHTPADLRERWLRLHVVVGRATGDIERALCAAETLLGVHDARERMQADQRAQLALRRSEEERRRAADFLSHDLRAPLSSMIALLDTTPLRRERDPLHTFSTIRELAQQAYTMTANFLSLRRLDELEPHEGRPIDLAELLDDACAQAQVWAQLRRIEIDVTVWARPTVRGEYDLLLRALLNVLNNAIKASPDGARIDASIDANARVVRIRIEDRGVGLPSPDEPTARPAHDYQTGFGHGLAFVRRVMRAHYGGFVLARRDGGGAAAVLELPRVESIGATRALATLTPGAVAHP